MVLGSVFLNVYGTLTNTVLVEELPIDALKVVLYGKNSFFILSVVLKQLAAINVVFGK
jgi:hypothetical protein